VKIFSIAVFFYAQPLQYQMTISLQLKKKNHCLLNYLHQNVTKSCQLRWAV